MTQQRFQGRTVLITGASLGVGRATAEAFHAEGANVVLVARRRGPLEEVAKTLPRSMIASADVTDVSAMQRVISDAIEQFGALHGLVNNAGLHHRGNVSTRTPEEIGAMVDVNLRAPLVLSRMVLPHLQQHGGFLVAVASLAGKVPLDGAATYSATKFGLRAFAFALAEELHGTNVSSSAVSPGPIETGFILDDLDEVEDIVFSQAMCTSEEVAEMILDCAHDGKLEREYPVSGGKLATLAYLAPSLRRMLKPRLKEKGRRAKEALRAARQEKE